MAFSPHLGSWSGLGLVRWPAAGLALSHVRLYVALNDPEWIDRVVAGVNRSSPGERGSPPPPFTVTWHGNTIEMRPRSGRWYPFVIAVPPSEVSLIGKIMFGPKGSVPYTGHSLSRSITKFEHQGQEYVGLISHHAVDLTSAFVQFFQEPTFLAFGQSGKLYVCGRAGGSPGESFVDS
jgi:hypothetical protein